MNRAWIYTYNFLWAVITYWYLMTGTPGVGAGFAITQKLCFFPKKIQAGPHFLKAVGSQDLTFRFWNLFNIFSRLLSLRQDPIFLNLLHPRIPFSKLLVRILAWVYVLGGGHLQTCGCKCHHKGCLNDPTFLNLRLCAAFWAQFMCHHELWPTSESHPFSFHSRSSVLWIKGRPVAKCDPLLGRVIQHDPQSRTMGDQTLDKWEHD